MRGLLSAAGMIAEGLVYLAVSPLVFIACKTMEAAGILDKDENDD